MIPIKLTLNGETVRGEVEPRTHLGDFLREQLRLTGTHLACEHGVCGACTVLLDDVPVRSCITYAVACDGAEVRTIEGFDDDEVMAELREAFTREHALQCGFCTPGMLVSARDIVMRLPGADEKRIRVELSGNLCRCTGFVGIVNAVKSVIDKRRTGDTARPVPAAAAVPAFAGFTPQAPTCAAAPAACRAPQAVSAPAAPAGAATTRIEEAFVVHHPPARVWEVFADMPAVVACLPGAELGAHDGDSVKGRINVRFGPMKMGFSGAASLERDAAVLRGLIRGAGTDSVSGSRARGDIAYQLAPEEEGRHTRVGVTLDYSLQGPLAQFSRSGLVKEFAGRLIADFAANLNARLDAAAMGKAAAAAPAQLDAGALFWRWLWQRLRRLFGRS